MQDLAVNIEMRDYGLRSKAFIDDGIFQMTDDWILDMAQTRFLKGLDVSNVWRRFERLIFSAKGNRKRGAMLIMKMLSQKDFQFVYYFSLFCLIACLFFILINRTYFWKERHLWYQLIPGFSPQKGQKIFLVSEIHISIAKIRVNWASPSLSKVWRKPLPKSCLAFKY